MGNRGNLYFVIYKPYKVLSQFTDEDVNKGLGSVFELPKNVYPVGRLDLDSEGLLILTNDRKLNHRLLDPKYQHKRTYWVEVEGTPTSDALEAFSDGVEINLKGRRYMTKKAKAKFVSEVTGIEERIPPVNYTKHPIRSWLEIELIEGKNRQVRKMTAAVGHPTLRLIRVGIEDLSLFPMKPGELTQISEKVLKKKLKLG